MCYICKSYLCVVSLALSLDNFTLNVTKAVTRGKAAELAKEKKMEGNRETRDKRNLYLAKEGLILPGSTAAQGLSKADLLKRQKAEKEKKVKLENPNYFVSQTRYVFPCTYIQYTLVIIIISDNRKAVTEKRLHLVNHNPASNAEIWSRLVLILFLFG